MNEQEIKEACKELEEALIENLSAEEKIIDAQSAKSKAQKRVQLAKIFLQK